MHAWLWLWWFIHIPTSTKACTEGRLNRISIWEGMNLLGKKMIIERGPSHLTHCMRSICSYCSRLQHIGKTMQRWVIASGGVAIRNFTINIASCVTHDNKSYYGLDGCLVGCVELMGRWELNNLPSCFGRLAMIWCGTYAKRTTITR